MPGALWNWAAARGVKLPLPSDVVVAPGLDQPEKAEVKKAGEVKPGDCVLDIAEGRRAGICRHAV